MQETSIRRGEEENIKKNNGNDIEFEGASNIRIFGIYTFAIDKSYLQHNQECRGIEI